MATATASTSVEAKIQRPERRVLFITVVGITPLRTQQLSEAERQKIGGKPPDTKEPKPSHEQLFEQAIYRDEEGRPCLPAMAVRKALVSAARSTDFHMTELRQFLNVSAKTLLLPILGSEPKLHVEYPTNKTAAKSRVLSVQARFDVPWYLTMPVIYNARKIHRDDVLSLVDTCGFAVSFGVGRVELGGTSGQFEIYEVKEDQHG